MNKRSVAWITIFVLLLILSSCGSEPDPDPTSLDAFYSTRDENQPDPVVPDELIVFGPSDQIDQLLTLTEFTRVAAAPKASINQEYVLINIGNLTVEDALEQIQTVVIEANLVDINSGKNYLMAAPWDVEGTPWDVEGTPWDVEGTFSDGNQPDVDGDSNESEGFVLKYPVSSGSTETVNHDLPWQHWAFQKGGPIESGIPFGIHLFEGDGTRTVTETGEGIRVIIYDTSPFTETGMITPQGLTTAIEVRNAGTVLPDVDLANTDNYTHTVEHGLFVAGLVHFVAPDAEIELVKVLNNQGVGNLYTLTTELEQLLIDNTGTEGNVDLNNVVINLSLGFHPEAIGVAVDEEFSNDVIVNEFHEQLKAISEAGAVIVSAAGNHSSEFLPENSVQSILESAPNYSDAFTIEKQVATMNPMFPARWEESVSVSGYSRGQLACFSNADENSIMAPSGNGYQGNPQPAEDGGKPVVSVCQSPREVCENLGLDYNCQYSMVSITTRGFGQWVGTSFGTPIVSGITALVLEKCNQDELLSAENVRTFLFEQYTEADQGPPNRLDINRILNIKGCPSG